MFAMEYASIIFLKTTGRSRIPSSNRVKKCNLDFACVFPILFCILVKTLAEAVLNDPSCNR